MKILPISTALISLFFLVPDAIAIKPTLEITEPTVLYGGFDEKTIGIQSRRYITLNPTDANAYLDRGMTRYNSGDKQGAIADFSQAIKINPQNADIYNERGITLAELGNIKGAIADFNQAIKVNPNLAQSYHNRGNVYVILGDKQRAIQDFQTAVKIYGQQGNKKKQTSSLEMLKRLQN